MSDIPNYKEVTSRMTKITLILKTQNYTQIYHNTLRRSATTASQSLSQGNHAFYTSANFFIFFNHLVRRIEFNANGHTRIFPFRRIFC